MKKLFVFVPAMLLVSVLLNAFVLKDKRAGEMKTRSLKDPSDIGFKSTDGGETWQDISSELPEIKQSINFSARSQNVVESDGVLVATGAKGIMRSTDKGKHWEWVISEGGVGIAIERIKGGFAAITYNTETESRRVRISLDSGKTWQAIDARLRPTQDISSIKQMGEYLICGHPDGIFRSADMGETWEKIHAGVVVKEEIKFVMPWDIRRFSTPGKVFKVYVSGNELYAVAVSAGC